jgi:hypothetical protein
MASGADACSTSLRLRNNGNSMCATSIISTACRASREPVT